MCSIATTLSCLYNPAFPAARGSEGSAALASAGVTGRACRAGCPEDCRLLAAAAAAGGAWEGGEGLALSRDEVDEADEADEAVKEDFPPRLAGMDVRDLRTSTTTSSDWTPLTTRV